MSTDVAATETMAPTTEVPAADPVVDTTVEAAAADPKPAKAAKAKKPSAPKKPRATPAHPTYAEVNDRTRTLPRSFSSLFIVVLVCCSVCLGFSTWI